MRIERFGFGGVWMLAAIGVALSSAACDDEELVEVVSFTDTAGRSCTMDRFDISSTAICDADPEPLVTCDAGLEAAFSVGPSRDPDTMITTLRNCAACVDRDNMMTYVASATCGAVECETDPDCVYDVYSCTGGVCTR